MIARQMILMTNQAAVTAVDIHAQAVRGADGVIGAKDQDMSTLPMV